MRKPSILGGLLALGLAAAHPAVQAWEPAAGTSAREVLLDARQDANEGRFSAAAAMPRPSSSSRAAGPCSAPTPACIT